MHCLPAYRGIEVSAEVIDGPQSVVFQQGHNRLHAARAAMAFLLGIRAHPTPGPDGHDDRSQTANAATTISRLIGEHEVTSQPQLIELLAEHGIEATQATVSRDLDDIGAIKVRVPSGNTVYAIPEFAPDRLAPVDQLRRVMGEWVAEVAYSGNIVVLRTPPGCAHVVASALDRSRIDGLLGTVAGDDTLMCVSADDRRLGARRSTCATWPDWTDMSDDRRDDSTSADEPARRCGTADSPAGRPRR